MKIYLILCTTICILRECAGQGNNNPGRRRGFLMPSLTDILRNRQALEENVVDLAQSPDVFGPPSGFEVPSPESASPVNVHIDHGASVGATHGDHDNVGNTAGNIRGTVPGPLSDIHGNIPPNPTGVHVDLPGEHGNDNDFPVVHSGDTPIMADRGVLDFNGIPSPVNLDTMVGLPGENIAPVDISLGPILPTLNEGPSGVNTAIRVGHSEQTLNHADTVFHAANVHNQLPNPGLSAEGFVDLATLGDAGMGFDRSHVSGQLLDLNTPFEPIQNALTPKLIGLPDAINQIGNLLTPGVSDGFISSNDGFISSPMDTSGIHNDIPQIIDQAIPQVGNKAHGSIGAAPSVHVDLPGGSGHPMDGTSFVHRDGVHQGTPVGSIHVDMPGQHGNPENGSPVIHREGPHIDPPAWNPNFNSGAPVGSVHVDMPGQHGNPENGSPTIHREGPHIDTPTPGGSVHVDMPGQHGVAFDGTPVIHREGPSFGLPPSTSEVHTGPSTGTSLGSVHVDLAGEHGNPMNGVPVIHRDGTPFGLHASSSNMSPGSPIGTPLGSVHVDMPGEHGNPVDGIPLIHREGQHGGIHDGHGIHIDAVGVHGNELNEPALHLPPGATIADARAAGVIPDLPVGGSIKPPDVLPGTINAPVPGGVLGGSMHVDMPGHHGHSANGIPLVHRETGPVVGQNFADHQTTHGIHIDHPNEHGNAMNEPALHLPPGATIADARAAGVIPPLQTVVPTGVLPGAPNVPVPGRPDHRVLVPHVPGRRQSLGDMLGIPTALKPVQLDTRNEFGPSPPIDGRTVLLTYDKDNTGGRGRGGRRRGGRQRGRGWRRGGGRGGGRGRGRGRGRGKGAFHDEHLHQDFTSTTSTTTTTTTTTPVQNRPGNGITVIRSSRPNPFGNLGNILRSALTGGSSNGGGLLGSLVQTALGTIGGRGGGMRGFGPPPGRMIMVPGRPPMFGGIFQG